MRRILLITTAVVIGLLCALAVIARSGGWPLPESPPRQGEALDALALKSHRAAHSRLALSRLIREPQNTWSNLAFVVGGAFLISVASSRSARAVGIALIGVGVGSFLYHASASRTLRHLDVAAMYWVFLIAVVFSVGSLMPRVREMIEAHTRLLSATALVLAIGMTSGRNLTVRGFKPIALGLATAATAGVVTLALLGLALRHRTLRAAGGIIAVLAAFATAAVCQVGDRPGGWLCDPDAMVQAHAVWHVLSAAAITFAFVLLDFPMEEQLERHRRQNA